MSSLNDQLDINEMSPKLSGEKLDTKTSPSKKTAVSVVFGSADKAEKYQKQIEKFLSSILANGDSFCCSTVHDEKSETIKKKHLKAEQRQQNNANGGRNPQMPLYDTTFDDTLEYLDISKETDNYPEVESQKMTCFNCLGDHHLNECPEEHVGSRIAINKRAVMENSQTIRYHTDDAQPLEKNGNICPGRISMNLRNALDLKANQLPLYIYHMRILGYPPGWMKEAEVEHSGLSIYDSDGNVVEDESNNKDSAKRFNGVNFIEFPGFNTPLPEGYHDDWKQLRMMPMQSHQQLSEALKHSCVMNSPNYKKRKNSQVQTSDHDDNVKRKKDDVREKKKELLTDVVVLNKQPDNEKAESADEKPSSVVVGSPLIDTGNPFKRLPDCSKFSADITEHLPYENLPDAVGAYDRKMRGVLDQVRLDMNRLLEKSPPNK